MVSYAIRGFGRNGSGYFILPDGTKPLPELKLICPVAFAWGQCAQKMLMTSLTIFCLKIARSTLPFTGGFHYQSLEMQRFSASLLLAGITCWTNNWVDCDLRRHYTLLTSPILNDGMMTLSRLIIFLMMMTITWGQWLWLQYRMVEVREITNAPSYSTVTS